ncbi:MAG: DUF4352 domain-containing protein [Ruminococcus sp.]|nr:DUF4352 domain-containing protein [Ruminococcus sp.]
MKISKISALLLCAAMALSVSAACEKDDKSSKSDKSISDSENYNNSGNEDTTKNPPQEMTLNPALGENQINADIEEEADANETIFKLNSIIEAEVEDLAGKKYIYLNVDISNTTDEDYSLSSLNNFYLLHGDNIMETSDLTTMFYAKNNLKDIAITQDPIIVPAKGKFSGFISGFEVPADLDSFTVGFYPTQNNANNKQTVIEVEVTPDDIQPAK